MPNFFNLPTDSLTPEAQAYLQDLQAALHILAQKNPAIIGRNNSSNDPAIIGYNDCIIAKNFDLRYRRGAGVAGYSKMNGSCGIFGQNHSSNSDGVRGTSKDGRGVTGYSEKNIGIYGKGKTWAGYFDGNVSAQVIHTEKLSSQSINVNNASFSTEVTLEEDVKLRIKKGGDIILENGADIAEDFDVSNNIEIELGTVMSLDEGGKLTPSSKAYDKKVVGVISGAGTYKPAIVLDKIDNNNKRLPIALMGKVFCKVDAKNGSIEIGDLLTTSDVVGHAMKAVDPLFSFGSVIGKALEPHKEGRGIIPILASLQ